MRKLFLERGIATILVLTIILTGCTKTINTPSQFKTSKLKISTESGIIEVPRHWTPHISTDTATVSVKELGHWTPHISTDTATVSVKELGHWTPR